MQPVEPVRQAVVIPITDSSQIPSARRAVLDVGRHLNLDADTIAKAEIVAVELAGNILQHGETVTLEGGVPTRRIRRPGELFVSSTVGATGIQILAVDSGRGIPNLDRAMADGFSTSSTPGLGLGAVKRLSREFSIFSAVAPPAARGTVVSAVVGPELVTEPYWDKKASVICTAMPGETVSGDSWATFESIDSTLFLMVDGLGHGTYAHDAATLSRQLFLRFAASKTGTAPIAPGEMLQQMHPLLRATRGAAIAVVRVDPGQRMITFCGVGNISGVISAPTGETRSMISHNGTIGHQMPRVQEFQYSYVPESLLVLHSDGINTSWKLQTSPGLDRQASATIAGAIYRDAWRGRDDATVLVARLA